MTNRELLRVSGKPPRLRRGGLKPLAPLTPLEPIAIGTLAQRAHLELRAAIKRGAFRPGEALTIRSLATIFGVSPTPVREALQQLAAEGAVEGIPNRSFRIPLMTRERFLDIRDVRANLEGLAAEKAAGRVSEHHLASLAALNRAMEDAIHRSHTRDYLEANEAFHFTVYRAAGSATLLHIIDSLWVQIGPSLNYLFADLALVTSLMEHHEAVLAALAAGDGDAAAAAIRRDILTAGQFLHSRGLG